MALSVAGASALVAGSFVEADMQTKYGRVLRAFYYKGKPTKVDAEIELPAVFALEMVAAKKLELIDKPAAKSEAKPEPKKESKDAR